MKNATAIPAETALDQILSGHAPDGLVVDGTLEVKDTPALSRLPEGLTVRRLILRNCPSLIGLPVELSARSLVIENCPGIRSLPTGLRCHEIRARESALAGLPEDIEVEFRLDLRDSKHLAHLPVGLSVGTLILRGCTALRSLPEGLDSTFLDLEGCAQLTGWPRDVTLRCGSLNLADCTGMSHLPVDVADLGRLDLRNCARITSLPEGLRVSSWIDVAGSGLSKLPPSLAGVRIRWRGVRIHARIAFQPESLTVDEILAETNTEVRRVMLERVGFEWFFMRADARMIDADRDPGGERKLMRIAMPRDEDLVCVSLNCPSTGRRYVLRVPPAIDTCRRAAAWLAGFDNPDDYTPVLET